MRKPDIELHVEQLVLQNVAPGDRHRVGQAVGEELTRLLTAEGLSRALAGGADIEHVEAGAFRLPPAARPSVVGVQVARSVHEGLRR